MLIDKNVKMSKQTLETIEGLSSFLLSVKTAIQDGFQYGDDIPPIISSAISDLLPIIDNLDDISSEFSEDPAAFCQTIAHSMILLAKDLGAWKK